MKISPNHNLNMPEAARETAANRRTRQISDKDMARLQKAAADFESIFIAQFLKGMRRSMPESGLFGKGAGGEIYAGMFEQEIANSIAGKGGLQLSDILIESLTKYQESDMPGTATLADYRLRTIRPAAQPTVSHEWDRDIIAEAAEKFDLDPGLVEAVIKVESAYKANAVSSKGAVGLMQLMPQTAKELGVKNRFDPRQNVFGGAKYLRMMLDRFGGKLVLALSAYNAGPAAVDRFMGIPPYKETQRYVQKVLQNYRDL